MLIHKSLILVFFVFCSVKCEYLDLREGVKCNATGEAGTCVNVYNCLKAKTDLANKTNVPICSYDGKTPIVCCTDCFTGRKYDFRDEVIDPNVGALWYEKSQSVNKFNEYLQNVDYPCKRYLNTTYRWIYDENKECHDRKESRTTSSDGIDFPRDPKLIHSVVLGYGEDLDSAQWLCGGSIISENYILTSANCTTTPSLVPVKFVGIGPLNGTGEPFRTHRVKKIIRHPSYRPNSHYHDIALLQTLTRIQFSEQVAPASIVLGSTPPPFPAVAWSDIGNGKPLSETLQSVTLTDFTYYDPVKCAILFPPQPSMDKGFNRTTQLCFGYTGKKITNCQGDHGGSIIARENRGCAYNIMGVTSRGRICGDAGGAALYTRLHVYVSWIENIVWPGLRTSYYTKRINNI